MLSWPSLRASARVLVGVVSLCVLAAGGRAEAQAPQDRSFSPQLFHPAPGPDTFITVEPVAPLKHKQWAVGLFFNYARNPLSILTYDDSSGGTPSTSAEKSTQTALIRHMAGAELWGAIGLIGRLQIALSLPMTVWQSGNDFTSPNPQPDGTAVRAPNGFAFGDPRVYLKARLYGKERDGQAAGFQIGLSHWLGVPVGKSSDFGGEQNYTGFHGEGRLLLGWDAERFHVGAFFGFHWRAHTSQFFSTEMGQQMTYGGAASVVAVKRWVTVVAELYGFHDFSTNINAGPLELALAAKLGVYPGLTLDVGLANGLIAGVGAAQPRVFVGAVYSPDTADRDHDGVPDSIDKCPDVPEDKDGFQDKDGCPDPDNDGDSILDRDDKCPNEKEDFDDFEDDDGCPDPDNDKDGIPDISDPCPNQKEDGLPPRPKDGCPLSATDTDGDGVRDDKDKCPNEAEDKDGFEDEDGCPDPDNDNDGIPDEFDQCPNEPEDMDGFQDEDGCPDPDNDNDGVLDKNDKCPNEPETINGYQDEDGCPDKGPPPKVKIERGQIVILEKIFFDTAKAKIQAKSFNLLDQVALDHQGARRLQDPHRGPHRCAGQGRREHQAVAGAGGRGARVPRLARDRGGSLTAAGYGSAQPIADNKSSAGREANRRVEFHIVEEPKGKAAPKAEPEEEAEPEKK